MLLLQFFRKYDFQKVTSSTLTPLLTKHFIGVPCDSPHERILFRILEFKILEIKQKLKVTIVANGKMTNCKYLANCQSYSKRSENWDSESTCRTYMGHFDLVVFKVILRSLDAFAILVFRKYDFQNATASTLILFSAKPFISIPVTVCTKIFLGIYYFKIWKQNEKMFEI